MMRAILALLALLTIAPLAACDESEVWHAPQPTLARMQEQPRGDPFEAMREVPPFTVARGQGMRPAPPPTRALVEQGRAQFETHCAPCHGIAGDGVSVVADKMLLRRPPSLNEPRIRALDGAQIYDVITRGYGLMPSYAWQLHSDERWSVVHYVRALQLSQSIAAASLPSPMRDELLREAR